MHIQSPQTTAMMRSPTGESIHELGGHAAGGLHLHSLAHITLPPGHSSPKHYHPTAEESYYILSGTARMVIDGETQTVHPGQMIAIRPPQVHQIFNDSDEEVVFLAVCVPAWTPDCSVFVE